MISSRIAYDTALAAAVSNGIAQSQSPGGAGSLTLNGSLVSGGVATLDSNGNARQVLFTFGADESAHTFTVTGTLLANGNSVTETVAGAAATATTVNFFFTVTSVTINAASAGTITVGTNGVGASPWKVVNHRKNPFQMGIGTILKSGTVNWTVQHTFSDVFDPAILPTAFDHSVIASKAANTDGNYAFAPIAIRTKINSGTGTVRTEAVQSQDR